MVVGCAEEHGILVLAVWLILYGSRSGSLRVAGPTDAGARVARGDFDSRRPLIRDEGSGIRDRGRRRKRRFRLLVSPDIMRPTSLAIDSSGAI